MNYTKISKNNQKMMIGRLIIYQLRKGLGFYCRKRGSKEAWNLNEFHNGTSIYKGINSCMHLCFPEMIRLNRDEIQVMYTRVNYALQNVKSK